MMNDEELVERLFAQSGPIFRYRIALEWMDLPPKELLALQQASLRTPEVQRWIALLNASQNVHGSKDSDAENPLAKLLEYGFDRRLPEFDAGVQRLLGSRLKQWDALVLLPFLVRAGYAEESPVAGWLAERVEKLYQTARRGSFDFYLSPQDAAGVPKPWRDKLIYRDAYGHAAEYALPTVFDFYTLAHCPTGACIDDLDLKFETIVAFLSDPRFQATPGGYGWDRAKRRCYAAGRVFLACAEPYRLVLFLELGAGFEAARRSDWFRQGLARLESYRTDQGTYCFPRDSMPEKTGTHIYGAAHMGMGEDRRRREALERESTFRALLIRKRMGADVNS